MRISDWSSDVCSSDLRYAEAARRACGRTHADAACLRRRQGIAGYAILVASNGGTLKRLIGILAGDAQRPEIDESEMRVSAARNDVGADRKSVVWGTSVSVRVDLGGRRIIKKKIH